MRKSHPGEGEEPPPNFSKYCSRNVKTVKNSRAGTKKLALLGGNNQMSRFPQKRVRKSHPDGANPYFSKYCSRYVNTIKNSRTVLEKLTLSSGNNQTSRFPQKPCEKTHPAGDGVLRSEKLIR